MTTWQSSEISRRELLRRTGLLGAAGALSMLGGPAFGAEAAKRSLTIALPSNPETLDAHQLRSVVSGSVLAPMVEGLLTRDPVTMEIKPALALSWRNLNPNAWEFKLRRGVKFHNGEEFNAESVKFSIARAIHTKLNTLPRVVWPPSFGQEVQIVDPYTVRITTKVPDPIVPNRLAQESMGMVPPGASAAFKDKFITDKTIGTGPYRFVEFVLGDRFVVEPNPDYWGPKPATPRIVWQVIPDPATRVAALQRGAVDIIVNLPVPLVPAVEGDPNLRVYSELGSTVHILFLNARETAPLKDRRVRQALNHAIDREAILKNLYGGRGKPLTTATARQVTNAIDAGLFAYDPDRAKRLLAEAGHPSGFELTLWQAVGRWSQAEEAAQVIAGYFDKIGVRTKLQTLEWGEYNKRASGSLFKDAFYYAIINGTWDASYTWGRFQPTFPAFRYYDAEGDLRKALVEYDQAFDPGKRKELATWIQKALRDEAVWVFLWQLDEIFGLSKKVKGFTMRPDHVIWVRETFVEA